MPTLDSHTNRKPPKILVIDDEPNFLFAISRTLAKAGFEVIVANDSRNGILKAQSEQPDLIILDVNMPTLNGFQVKQALDNHPDTRFTPTIFLTALADRTHTISGLTLAEDYLTKPVDPDILILRLEKILGRVDLGYKQAVQDSKKNIFSNDRFEQWGQAVEVHDRGTGGHTQRVTCWCVALGRSLGLQEKDLANARKGAMLHDIGKLAIPENILDKPGALTEGEWEIMREHPGIAVDMLKDYDQLRPALDIPHYHHERWDGKGYPEGLKGEAIPLLARIFSVVDVYDALLSKRPYKVGLDEKVALKMLLDESGKAFDPHIVEHFIVNFELLKKEVVDECGTYDFSD